MEKIKKSFLYKYLVYRYLKYKVDSNPISEINRYFNKVFGRNANLNEPKNLIEKIYWMQLYTDTSKWTLCADKYKMREYVAQKGYSDNLPQLYGHWNSPEQIDFSLLPKSFVLKTNNGCATVMVVKDKSLLKEREVRRQLTRWLKIPFGYSGYEPHYLRICPCIIAEEFLEQDDIQNSFSPKSIVDYKVWCINGNPESVFVGYNRIPGNLSMALFDTNWNDMSDRLVSNDSDTYHPDVIIPKPQCLAIMLEMASNLSSDFPECRVDFYIIDNKPIIGELTFSSGYGYFTEEYYDYLGSKINLCALNKIVK